MVKVMRITAYIRPECPWSGTVLLVLEKYGLSFDKKDVAGDPAALDEMTKRTGQSFTPCVEIDGVMLPDTTGQEVEDYLLSRELVQTGSADADELDANSVLHVGPYIAGVRLADTTRFF
jgi:monothiol glutaredoxin